MQALLFICLSVHLPGFPAPGLCLHLDPEECQIAIRWGLPWILSNGALYTLYPVTVLDPLDLLGKGKKNNNYFLLCVFIYPALGVFNDDNNNDISAQVTSIVQHLHHSRMNLILVRSNARAMLSRVALG